MLIKFFRLFLIGCLGVTALVPVSGFCEILPNQEDVSFEAGTALADHVLDTQRGGFVSPEGMLMTLRISRESYINNILQPENTFSTGAIQVNGRNIVASDLAAVNQAMNAVIQNNRDNVAIRSITLVGIELRNISGLIESAKSAQNIRSSQNVLMLR